MIEKSDQTNTQLENFKHICEQAGLKLTHQRYVIYRELASTKEHPSAEAIYQRVKEEIPTIALDTVYRTLTTLEQLGAIVRVHTAEDHGRFDADTAPHHHFFCTSCKTVLDFEWDEFDQAPLPQQALDCGQIDSKHLVLRGICKNCLERN